MFVFYKWFFYWLFKILIIMFLSCLIWSSRLYKILFYDRYCIVLYDKNNDVKFKIFNENWWNNKY